ncbi:hypothetical protein BDZ89DRAFT_1008806 [Hymenopellis radicata]|nr:hypothetical protein BDZ89DRAFT_1008806 [Hymenopellis radicata]
MNALTPPEVAANAQGPMFLGLLINAVLYGIMIAQIYFFFATYKHDELWLKSFVVLIFVLDTANTVFDFTYLYECFVNHYGDVTYIAKATWIFATDPALTGIITTLVQLFFAWRIRVLTAKNWLAITTVFLSILALAGALATAAEEGDIHPEYAQLHKFKEPIIVWLGCGCACDILITTLLVWHLRGKKTGFEHTDYVVDKIIRMTVQTGLIRSLCAVVDLATFLALNNGVHLIFNLPLCKLYTNSLMSSLNARETTPSATKGNSRGSTTLSVSNRLSNTPSFSLLLQPPSQSRSDSDSGPVGIEMTVSKHRDSFNSRDSAFVSGRTCRPGTDIL